jgi:hypothetical protein
MGSWFMALCNPVIALAIVPILLKFGNPVLLSVLVYVLYVVFWKVIWKYHYKQGKLLNIPY